jgi:tRNA(Ile)-lysidine synthetase-like protein
MVGRRNAAASADDVPLIIRSADTGAGTCLIGGRRYVARWNAGGAADRGQSDPGRGEESARANGIGDSGRTATFDSATLRFPLTLRGWRPGDRIRFSYGSKKLKELFRERGVGRSARRCVPVLSDAQDNVLWVAGVARVHDAAFTKASKQFQVALSDDDDST